MEDMNAFKMFIEKFLGKRPLGDLGVEGRIMYNGQRNSGVGIEELALMIHTSLNSKQSCDDL